MNKTINEVEEYLAALSPKPDLKQAIRRLPTPKVVGRTITQEQAPLFSPPSRPRRVTKNQLKITAPERYSIKVSVGKSCKEKLDRLAEVLNIRDPQANLEVILETAFDCALNKKDPKRKAKRAEKRAAKQKNGQDAAPKKPSPAKSSNRRL